MTRRNTIQKQLVLSTVCKLMSHPSAEEVYTSIVGAYPGISKATVYRNLNQLAESGQLIRLSVPGSADRYDATVSNHYHSICKHCSKLIDICLDKPIKISLNEKVMKENMIDDFVILFTGVCPECREIYKTEEKLKDQNKKTKGRQS